MKINELKEKINRIGEKTKNAELLGKILSLARLSRGSCRKLMLYKQSSSFDHYIYHFKEETFPPEFSYLFLNAVFDALYPKHNKAMKKKKDYIEFIKKNKKGLWQKQRDEFANLIKNCIKIGILEKLITPALEFHALSLIRMGHVNANKKGESFIDAYIKIVNPKAVDYLETGDNGINWSEDLEERFQEESKTIEYDQYRRLVNSLKNFYPIMEWLRKLIMTNFIPSHEFINIKTIISGNEESSYNQKFSKNFLRDELGFIGLENLLMIKVKEDNMQGTFDKNDNVLIKKHPSYISAKKGIPSGPLAYNWKDGIYAIEIGDKIKLRRLQFSHPNWKSSTLQENEKDDIDIPEFLQEEANKEIEKVFTKGIEKVKLYEVDELLQKYGTQNSLLRKYLKPLINLDKNQDDYFYGKKYVDHSKNYDLKVNIICDNNKYPTQSVKFEDLLICGEVLWKSSSFRDNNSNIEFEKEIPSKIDLDLFLEPRKLKEIA